MDQATVQTTTPDGCRRFDRPRRWSRRRTHAPFVTLSPYGGDVSVDVHSNLLAFHPGPNHKTGATTKPVNELHLPMLSERSPQSRVRDALQKLRSVLLGYCRPFELLRFAFQDDDGRLANVQPQLIRSIRMKKMKEIVY